MQHLIYMLDDEQDILELVELHLKKNGYLTACFDSPADFWNALGQSLPSLIVLDLMLPGADGMEICKELRRNEAWSTIPVVMLTARDEEIDKVLGLELGADDYLTKPFSPRELMARIKAILRRSAPKEKATVLCVSDALKLNLKTYETWVHDRKIELTATEFRLLRLLVERKGWVYSRNQILDYLWGKEKIVIDRTVDVHIKNLREKLGEAGKSIKNIRGVGYKFDA
ncbi:MAG: response regulator transcription factor [Candidatus Cloacimonetes bacterium]|nr:response regulator transcription factor [Candidatus Cloacimonadota bacterium]